MWKDITIFISYAHKDERLCGEIDKQLSWLKRSKNIKVWDARSIHIGADRQQEVNHYFNTAQIILLLISPDFMASERCYTEMIRAMERHEAGETHVIPVLLRPVDWADAPFAKLQVLPTDAQPVTSKKGYKRDDAFFNIAQGIRNVIEGRRLQWLNNISINDGQRHNLDEAPEVINFHGRKNEFDKLKHWIVDDRCRLVAVLGLGGIGKTSLALKLVEEINGKFEYVFWRSLEHNPPLKSLLQECILFVSNEQEVKLPEDIGDQIGILIQYLQDRRCLFILDNFESVMQGEHSPSGSEEYETLLKRIAQARVSRSCFLLTSREKSRELAYFAEQTGPVRTLTLLDVNIEEGREILRDNGLFDDNESLMNDLVHLSSGNPLTLKVVSNYIHEFLNDNIMEFLREGRTVMGKIEDILEQQFLRLSTREEEAIYWLAIEREAVSLSDLRENLFTDASKKILLDALLSLQRRSLIETRGVVTFTLQPVIMEYATRRFVQQICQEVEAGTIKIFGSHALMKCQSQDYVRESQVRFILDPIVRRLYSNLREEEFGEKCRQMLSQLRARYDVSYAAGNILHMLIQSGSDLHQFDFSCLTLRQVYLQGISLHDVNFEQTHFIKPLFTDTFGDILSTAWNPDGSLLAAGTDNGEIRVWDIANGTLKQRFRKNSDWIRSVAFSPDGAIVAGGSEDYTVQLWNIKTGVCRTLRGHTDIVRTIAFSSDGRFLASGGHDGCIMIWNVKTSELVSTLHHPEQEIFYSVAFRPDGRLLASGSEDPILRIWDIHSGHLFKSMEGHTDSIGTVAFSPDGTMIASGGDACTICLWNASTGELLKKLTGHTDWIWYLAFTTDGQTLASCGEDYTVRLWSINSGQCLKTLLGHTNTVWSAPFHLEGQLLASGSADQTVRLWDVRKGWCLKVLQGYTNGMLSIAFSPDGKTIACGSQDKKVRLWDVKTGQCRKILAGPEDRVWSVAFSHDGRQLVSGSTRALHMWDMLDGQHREFSGYPGWVYSVTFSPNGKTIASIGDTLGVQLWDINSGSSRTLTQNDEAIAWGYCVSFSPDGKWLAGGSEHRGVYLWDLEASTPPLIIKGESLIYTVAFNPSGDILAGGAEGTNVIYLWDVRSGHCLTILHGHTGSIRDIVFSPDGQMVASGSDDHTIRLWDAKSGLCGRVLQGHSDVIMAVAFSPNGRTIASGSQDGTIKLWNVRTGRCLITLRSDRPYERMDISGIKGITEVQKTILKSLGAIERVEENARVSDF